MKFMNLSISTLVMRFYLMIAVTVTLGFFGFLYLGVILGMIIFLSTLLGIQFKYLNPLNYKRRKEIHWPQQQRQHHPAHH